MSVLAPSRLSRIVTDSRASRWKLPQGAGFALGVYALTRLFVVVAVTIASSHQVAVPAGLSGYHSVFPTGRAPGYWAIMTNWDGQWYLDIATNGYPSDLPRDAAGRVLPNVWAFYPLFPLLAGALMWVTGLSFTLVAPALSLGLGAVAVVVLFCLVRDAMGTTAARLATLLTCTFMTAPVLQAAYTESLALLLLCSSLLLLRRRRYLWAAIAIVLLALTRNIVLAMAPVILLHGLVRWRGRAEDQFSRADLLKLAGLASVCVAATGLWPATAAAATGQPSAYIQTMAAWGGGIRVLIEWPLVFLRGAGIGGLVLLLLLLGCLFGALARPEARRWGPELWGWAIAYPCYLLLATGVGSSSLRHLLLAFPFSLIAVEVIRAPRSRFVGACLLGSTVAAGLALQWIWIANVLIVNNVAHGLSP